jgi:uncharacterized damage-inducible protein DinB
MHMTTISKITELIIALQNANQRVTRWFTEIPAENFFTRQGEIWSASDNLDHLIRSHKPISKALKLPKFTLQAMFGKPERRSKTYEEICDVYKAEIAKGAQASGHFLPEQQSPVENAEEKKVELLEHWSKASAELVETAGKWNENDLDGYLLPHPLIGKLTIREMLFFTIYHNLRHASQEGD